MKLSDNRKNARFVGADLSNEEETNTITNLIRSSLGFQLVWLVFPCGVARVREMNGGAISAEELDAKERVQLAPEEGGVCLVGGGILKVKRSVLPEWRGQRRYLTLTVS